MGLEAALTQEPGGLLAAVAVSADHRHRALRVEGERLEARQPVDLPGRHRAKVEGPAELHAAARDLLGRTDVEDLHRLADIEPAGELLSPPPWPLRNPPGFLISGGAPPKATRQTRRGLGFVEGGRRVSRA